MSYRGGGEGQETRGGAPSLDRDVRRQRGGLQVRSGVGYSRYAVGGCDEAEEVLKVQLRREARPAPVGGLIGEGEEVLQVQLRRKA
jgi:hypothetical protein